MHTNIRRIRKLLVVAMMAGATPSAFADVSLIGTSKPAI